MNKEYSLQECKDEISDYTSKILRYLKTQKGGISNPKEFMKPYFVI